MPSLINFGCSKCNICQPSERSKRSCYRAIAGCVPLQLEKSARPSEFAGTLADVCYTPVVQCSVMPLDRVKQKMVKLGFMHDLSNAGLV